MCISIDQGNGNIMAGGGSGWEVAAVCVQALRQEAPQPVWVAEGRPEYLETPIEQGESGFHANRIHGALDASGRMVVTPQGKRVVTQGSFWLQY